ncbi:MAG: SIMPL domain-containing protein [Nitrospira sp.]
MGRQTRKEGGYRMVVIGLLVLLGFPVVVQAYYDEPKPEIPSLTVSETGMLALAPDTAFVTFGLETPGKSLAEAQRRNAAVMSKVMDQLRGLQIEKERIQTSSFTVTPQYRPPSTRPAPAPPAIPEIVGYIVSNMVTVEIRVLDKAGTIIEEVLKAGANSFQGLHWGLHDEQPARLSALKQAAAKAREKAAVLSEALQLKLVRVLSVSEGGHVVRPAAHVARMALETHAGNVPISAGELKVEASVTLVYEIAPN